MITVEHLTKRYGSHLAVDGIGFRIAPREIVGFLGPNGAGKSTTMNIITGYLSMTAGRVVVGGFDILEEPARAKSLMGYLPEHPALYRDMTVWEYLRFASGLKGRKPDRGHIEGICKELGIHPVLDRLIKNLSKGYQQRVGLAQALIGDPPALILDEPTVGLDPAQIAEIRQLIRRLGRERAVILSTHILPEVQLLCDRIIILNRGKIVANDSAQRLKERISPDSLHLFARVAGPRAPVLELLRSVPGVREAEPLADTGQYRLQITGGDDTRIALFHALAEGGFPLIGLKESETTLEQVFMGITTEDIPSSRQGG